MNHSRFYIHIEDKIETPCDVINCRLIRQNVKKTTENKQYWGNDGCSCRKLLPIRRASTNGSRSYPSQHYGSDTEVLEYRELDKVPRELISNVEIGEKENQSPDQTDNQEVVHRFRIYSDAETDAFLKENKNKTRTQVRKPKVI